MNELKQRLIDAAREGFGRRAWMRNAIATFVGTAAGRA
jgi:hypothetical protein